MAEKDIEFFGDFDDILDGFGCEYGYGSVSARSKSDLLNMKSLEEREEMLQELYSESPKKLKAFLAFYRKRYGVEKLKGTSFEDF